MKTLVFAFWHLDIFQSLFCTTNYLAGATFLHRWNRYYRFNLFCKDIAPCRQNWYLRRATNKVVFFNVIRGRIRCIQIFYYIFGLKLFDTSTFVSNNIAVKKVKSVKVINNEYQDNHEDIKEVE